MIAAYRLILGREPDEAGIDYHLGLGFPDVYALGRYFCGTEEFRDRSRGAQDPLHRPATVFLGDRVLTHTHRGHKIYLPPTDVDLAPHLMTSGVWERNVEAAIERQLRPGARAVDVGANIGYHTLAMAAAVGPTGRVDAFEANPQLIPLLRATFFVNGIRSWTHLHHVALMDQPGRIVLAAEPDHFGSGNAVPAAAHPAEDVGPWSGYHQAYSVRHEVTATTLDAHFGADPPPLDLIRLDIEGSEPQALRGASGVIARSPTVRIIAEWSTAMMASRADVGAFVAWLTEQGFGFWRIRAEDRGLDPLPAADTLNLPHCDLVISRQEPA